MLEKLIHNAQRSPVHLWILNTVLSFVIPFNRPHGIRIKSLSASRIATLLPHRYRNYNHIKGTHACALAAATEFSTGVLLLGAVSPSTYRLIMQKLTMEYHYQAREDVIASCELDASWIEREVIVPLKSAEKVSVTVTSTIHDTAGNHISTGEVVWQIKEWKKVRSV